MFFFCCFNRFTDISSSGLYVGFQGDFIELSFFPVYCSHLFVILNYLCFSAMFFFFVPHKCKKMNSVSYSYHF